MSRKFSVLLLCLALFAPGIPLVAFDDQPLYQPVDEDPNDDWNHNGDCLRYRPGFYTCGFKIQECYDRCSRRYSECLGSGAPPAYCDADEESCQDSCDAQYPGTWNGGW